MRRSDVGIDGAYRRPWGNGDAMAHLFFHLRDGSHLIRDPDGTPALSIAAARTEAYLSARELVAQSIMGTGRVGIERCFEVCDSKDRTVLVVPFREALHDASGLGTTARSAKRACNTEMRWKALAAETRSIANTVTDRESRHILLGIALGYDRLAKFENAHENLTS